MRDGTPTAGYSSKGVFCSHAHYDDDEIMAQLHANKLWLHEAMFEYLMQRIVANMRLSALGESVMSIGAPSVRKDPRHSPRLSIKYRPLRVPR